VKVSCVCTCFVVLLAGQLQGCAPPSTGSSVPAPSPPIADASGIASPAPPEATANEPAFDMKRVPGMPGANIHPSRAEVFFRDWHASCAPPGGWCVLISPDDLTSKAYYTKRVTVSDPAVVERLWADYIAVKSSKVVMPSADCGDDARIMAVFHTSEPTLRWFAAGQGCPAPGGKVMMVVEGRWLREKNGQVLRDMADDIGVAAQMEAAVPDIFR